MTKIKNILLIVLTSCMILGFGAYELLKTPDEYSLSERRTLAKMPEVSFESLLSGKYMSEFEDFSLDQFFARDTFRSVKAATSRYLFRQKDNHGIYISNGHLSKLEYPANEAKLDNSAQKIGEVYDKFISGSDCKVYLSVIPDKNYFLAPLGGYPMMDYESVTQTLRDKVGFASYIDLYPLLELDDYYNTDQHWKQEKLPDVAKHIAEAMDSEISLDFSENVLDVPFRGAYCGQAALSFKPDTFRYLTSDILASCKVTLYPTGKPQEGFIYDMKKGMGKDPYELFLSGAEPLVVIENPSSDTDRELVVFRDSFTSSLAPLLASGYSKITLVDLRYMHTDLISNYITFENKDVLFIYSTLVLNNNISM